MGKKSAPTPTPVYVERPDNTYEMELLQKQIDQSAQQAAQQAAIAQQSLASAEAAQRMYQKQFEEMMAQQEAQFQAPKDMVLGEAPTNTEFKTFTPSTPKDVGSTDGLEGTRLSSLFNLGTPKPSSKKTTKVKDPLGIGIPSQDFGLNV